MKHARLAAALAALALSGAAQAEGVPGQGTWETSLQPRDLNGDSVADAFYDTDLDITWLRDANVNGKLTNGAASAWAQYLSFEGYYGWRLPSMDGEMAHLWYVELGNTAGGPMTNTGDFQNLQADSYWLDTPTVWNVKYAFSTVDGSQTGYRRGLWLIDFYAVAVHAGDVTAVPEPEGAAMMLVGFGIVMAALRRRPR